MRKSGENRGREVLMAAYPAVIARAESNGSMILLVSSGERILEQDDRKLDTAVEEMRETVSSRESVSAAHRRGLLLLCPAA